MRIRQYPADELQAGDDSELVDLRRQIIRMHGGGVERVWALQFDLASALGPQLIGDRGEAGKLMQPVLWPLGAERRDRDFDVRRGEPGTGTREQGRGRADHRQG